MEIEIKTHSNIRDHYEVYVDGEKWRVIHRAIFGKCPRFSSPSSWEEWEGIFYLHEYKRAKGYILWRLSSQSYHSEQLAKLLIERLVSSHTTEQVIQEFKKMGALDDESWMENAIKNGQKKYGMKTIFAKLRAKGISAESLQKISQIHVSKKNEIESIENLLKTRYRSKDLTQYKERQKVVASLMRKGFSYSLIQEALTWVD